MHEITSPLFVTLACGLQGAGKSTIARALTGAGSDGTPFLGNHDVVEDFTLDLGQNLCDVADDGQQGHVVVELTPDVDPVETALVLEAMFASRPPSARSVQLREIVVAASAGEIRTHFFGDKEIAADDYETGERLARQLEIATTVVMTHTEAIPQQKIAEAVALAARLNPLARLVVTSQPLAAGSMSMRPLRPRVSMGQEMGWMKELAGTAGPPRSTEGISVVVFRDPRPFHPGRLAEVIAHHLVPDIVGQILRSRGLTRLASRPGIVGSWSTTGGVFALDPTGMASWDPDSPVGQELVFFGKDLRPNALVAVLATALLDSAEIVAGPTEWAAYPDEFPSWEADTHRH